MKKDFKKNNPVNKFISTPIDEEPIEGQVSIYDQTKKIEISNIVVPKVKEETRSKRVNFLLQPTTYEKAQKKCKEIGISMNECINQLLNNWVDDNE